MRTVNSFLLVFVLFSGIIMINGCAPVWIMNQPTPTQPQEIPVYRPIDWDHILLSNRVAERISFKDKIVFVAEIGTSKSYQFSIFWADSDGKNLKKLYDVQDGFTNLKNLGNSEKVIATCARFSTLIANSFFIFIDAQNGTILKEIKQVGYFSFSPDEKKIVFEKREGDWKSGFDLCVLEMGEDMLPKRIDKIIHFSPNIKNLYGTDAIERMGQMTGYEVMDPIAAIEWNQNRIIFRTAQSFIKGFWGPYDIFRTYSVNSDGTNLQKIEEHTKNNY